MYIIMSPYKMARETSSWARRDCYCVSDHLCSKVLDFFVFLSPTDGDEATRRQKVFTPHHLFFYYYFFILFQEFLIWKFPGDKPPANQRWWISFIYRFALVLYIIDRVGKTRWENVDTWTWIDVSITFSVPSPLHGTMKTTFVWFIFKFPVWVSHLSPGKWWKFPWRNLTFFFVLLLVSWSILR